MPDASAEPYTFKMIDYGVTRCDSAWCIEYRQGGMNVTFAVEIEPPLFEKNGLPPFRVRLPSHFRQAASEEVQAWRILAVRRMIDYVAASPQWQGRTRMDDLLAFLDQ